MEIADGYKRSQMRKGLLRLGQYSNFHVQKFLKREITDLQYEPLGLLNQGYEWLVLYFSPDFWSSDSADRVIAVFEYQGAVLHRPTEKDLL